MKRTIIIVIAAIGVAALSASAQLRQVGSFRLIGNLPVPVGFTNAYKFQVDLPDVPHTNGGGTGKLLIACPEGTSVSITPDHHLAFLTVGAIPVQVDVHLSGHGGTGRFAASPLSTAWRDQYYLDLLAANHIVVEINWLGGGWFQAQLGVASGMAALYGRPATAFTWIYDNIATPYGVPMDLIGISGGSCQIAGALAFFERVADVTKKAVLISSMPFDEERRGVLGTDTLLPDYTGSELSMLDKSIGAKVGTGPAALHDPAWGDFWDLQSVTATGNTFLYPSTQIVMIEGARDSKEIVSRANHYQSVLVGAGQPVIREDIIGMHHEITPEGGARVEAHVLAQ